MTDPKKNRSTQIFSQVCAGFPNPADDYAEDSLDLNEYLVKHPSSTFFVKVKGNSMEDASIREGDILVVDRSLEPYPNAIILAVLNGEFTVKRVEKIGEIVVLKPENKRFGAITVASTDDFEVWGVVSYIIHRAK